MRHLECYSATVAAKITEITKTSTLLPPPLPILSATFLVLLTIINVYLGVGNKMVRLGADFDAVASSKSEKSRYFYLNPCFFVIFTLLPPHFNGHIENFSAILRGWAWLTTIKI